MMKTLLIKLSAPLQSYGNQASFNRRTTTHYPTKSAIIGMIAAAQGLRRDDYRIESLNELAIAVRVDQPGKLLNDFQFVEWKPIKREREREREPKITYRNYLQDAIFMVAITGKDDILLDVDEIDQALHHPKFALFLGRRSNPMAGNLKTTIIADEDPVTVLKRYPWQAAKWFRKQCNEQAEYRAEIIADASLLPKNPNVIVKDAVGSFKQRHRWHNYRAVVTVQVLLENDQYNFKNDHDIWNAL